MVEDRKIVCVGIGMPAALKLEVFGRLIYDAFGDYAYLVGSALFGKTWRDVDVRLILFDEEYDRQGLGDPRSPHSNRKWVSLVFAFSALGREVTGLPIDFQIQQQTEANREYDSARSCIGIE
jgi:predicted nucleotidyltransferase